MRDMNTRHDLSAIYLGRGSLVAGIVGHEHRRHSIAMCMILLMLAANDKMRHDLVCPKRFELLQTPPHVLEFVSLRL